MVTAALRSASYEVEEARRALVRATTVTWSSTAADRYRRAVDEAAAGVRQVARLLEDAVVAVPTTEARCGAPTAWPGR